MADIHSFSTKLATQIGVVESVVVHNFWYWIVKNAANRKHFNEGTFWTYNTNQAMCEMFEYLSLDQVKRIINKLTDNSEGNAILIKGNFNKVKFDRTLWYAFSEYGERLMATLGYDLGLLHNAKSEIAQCIKQNHTMHLAKSPNGESEIAKSDCAKSPNPTSENAEPIPYSITNSITDTITNTISEKEFSPSTSVEVSVVEKKKEKKSNKASSKKFDFKSELIKLGVSETTASDWMEVRKKKGGVNTETAFKSLLTELRKAWKKGIKPEQCIQVAITKNWRGFEADWLDKENNHDTTAKTNNGNNAYNGNGRPANNAEYAEYHLKRMQNDLERDRANRNVQSSEPNDFSFEL